MNIFSDLHRKLDVVVPLDRLVREANRSQKLSRYSVGMDQRHEKSVRIGLCERCKHVRRIESDRGSVFYMCQLSSTDPKFPKYPRLPVLRCTGYEPIDRDNLKKPE
jgi:hypothetical protein